jgi:hypothetical protein
VVLRLRGGAFQPRRVSRVPSCVCTRVNQTVGNRTGSAGSRWNRSGPVHEPVRFPLTNRDCIFLPTANQPVLPVYRPVFLNRGNRPAAVWLTLVCTLQKHQRKLELAPKRRAGCRVFRQINGRSPESSRSHRPWFLGVGKLPDAHYPNPKYPDPDPNYPNPHYSKYNSDS